VENEANKLGSPFKAQRLVVEVSRGLPYIS